MDIEHSSVHIQHNILEHVQIWWCKAISNVDVRIFGAINMNIIIIADLFAVYMLVDAVNLYIGMNICVSGPTK